jgi:hypothetical protein
MRRLEQDQSGYTKIHTLVDVEANSAIEQLKSSTHLLHLLFLRTEQSPPRFSHLVELASSWALYQRAR